MTPFFSHCWKALSVLEDKIHSVSYKVFTKYFKCMDWYVHTHTHTHTINSSVYYNSMGALFYLTAAASHFPLVHTTYKTSLMDRTNMFFLPPQLVKELLAFYGTLSVTMITTASYLSLSSARLIQSKPSQSIYHPTILSYMPRTSKWSLSLRFSYQNPECTFLFSAIHSTYPAHLILLDHPNIW